MTGELGKDLLRQNNRLPSYAIFALILGVFLRIFAVFSAPVHSQSDSFPAYNDEASHLNHVLFRTYGTGQPEQRFSVTDGDALVNGEVEYYQPPLYYQAMALVVKVLPAGQNLVWSLRLISLMLWLMALYLISISIRDTHLRGLLVVVGSLLGAGFIPSTTINNDALYGLAIGGIYYLSLKNRSFFDLVNLSLLVSVAIWIKLAALTLIPMVFVSIYIFNSETRVFLKKSLLAVFVILWTTFPLWLQRIDVFGHPLSLGEGGGEHLGLPFRELIVSVVLSLSQPWFEFWYSPWVKISVVLLFVLMAGLMTYGTILFRKKEKVLPSELKQYFFPIWGVGALFATLGWIYYGVRFNQMETRLLLGAAPGLVVLLGWPVTLLESRFRTIIGWTLTGILAISFISWS